MRNHWRLILPIVGLLLFAGVTYDSLQKRQKVSGQYLWWSILRLDSDPMNAQHPAGAPCIRAKGSCGPRSFGGGVGKPFTIARSNSSTWNPASLWVSPELASELLILSAFPALAAGMSWVRLLGSQGISEISSFMSMMPLFVAAWYYTIGRFIDHWLYRRLLSSQSPRGVRSYVFAFGAFIPSSFITICKSFQASPFCRGSRSRNAGW